METEIRGDCVVIVPAFSVEKTGPLPCWESLPKPTSSSELSTTTTEASGLNVVVNRGPTTGPLDTGTCRRMSSPDSSETTREMVCTCGALTTEDVTDKGDKLIPWGTLRNPRPSAMLVPSEFAVFVGVLGLVTGTLPTWTC